MFQTIVLALDGSASSDNALDCATEIARTNGSQIHVVHVVEIAVGRGAGPAHPDEEEMKAKIRQQVGELVASGISAELEFYSAIAGGPAGVIAETAERVGADTIVAGTRGHTVLAGLLLGSVTQRLLHVAPCPVLTVPMSYQPRSETRASSAAAAAG
jgi:nucleotide-binding universal stress UspA family protein